MTKGRLIDRMAEDLAEGVRRGELHYEASTGRYTLTEKGQRVLKRELREAGVRG